MSITYYHTVNGRIIGESTGGVRTDYLTDALGSVTATVDQAQAVLNTYRFKPYGEILNKSGVNLDPRFLWIGSWGYRQDPQSYSSHFVRHRHYSNQVGLWMSIDPYWPSEHGYSYANNNSVSNIDPSGLQMSMGIHIGGFLKKACPLTTASEMRPCSSSPFNGNCPNVNPGDRGKTIDLHRWDRIGKSDDLTVCDPATIDRDAFNKRIIDLERIIDGLCNGGAGGGSSDYHPWMITIPCYVNVPGYGFVVRCNIRCTGNPAADNMLGSYFDKKPYAGIGCMTCCLTAHENYHCYQIVFEGARVPQGDPSTWTEDQKKQANAIECAAFKKEVECLKKVLEGKKCSD